MIVVIDICSHPTLSQSGRTPLELRTRCGMDLTRSACRRISDALWDFSSLLVARSQKLKRAAPCGPAAAQQMPQRMP